MKMGMGGGLSQVQKLNTPSSGRGNSGKTHVIPHGIPPPHTTPTPPTLPRSCTSSPSHAATATAKASTKPPCSPRCSPGSTEYHHRPRPHPRLLPTPAEASSPRTYHTPHAGPSSSSAHQQTPRCMCPAANLRAGATHMPPTHPRPVNWHRHTPWGGLLPLLVTDRRAPCAPSRGDHNAGGQMVARCCLGAVGAQLPPRGHLPLACRVHPVAHGHYYDWPVMEWMLQRSRSGNSGASWTTAVVSPLVPLGQAPGQGWPLPACCVQN